MFPLSLHLVESVPNTSLQNKFSRQQEPVKATQSPGEAKLSFLSHSLFLASKDSNVFTERTREFSVFI